MIPTPFRYRNYVYDTETGLYYLQSRYYDPKVGRFINADAFASTGQGVLGNNMFAYCGNNPVNYEDLTGLAPRAIFATAYQYDGDFSVFGVGQAITVTVCNNSVYIDAFMIFTGDVDIEYLINGIEQYWSGTYSYESRQLTVYVNVNQGVSSNGNAIQVVTSTSYGRSYCTMNERQWRKTKESTITVYSEYYTYVGCDWTIAHEFGHSLGVYDYYTQEGLPGFDQYYQSIMNIPGVHATGADIVKMLLAFSTNTYQEWYCNGGY